MSALDELTLTPAGLVALMRQRYRALGWSLWRLDGCTLIGEPVTYFYASATSGGPHRAHGETIATTSPLDTLRAVLAHPATTAAAAAAARARSTA